MSSYKKEEPGTPDIQYDRAVAVEARDGLHPFDLTAGETFTGNQTPVDSIEKAETEVAPE